MNPATKHKVSGEYLSVLLANLMPIDKKRDSYIENLCVDSRDAGPGSLFFAVPGVVDDGRNHIRQAVDAGVSAVVYEADGWDPNTRVDGPLFGVRELRRQIGTVANIFYRQPSGRMHVIGITGTNGKSTCASLTAQALEYLGKKCGIIGTLGSGFIDSLGSSLLTTPDPISLQRNLASLVNAGARYVCLEVSSHSLDQSRTAGVQFDTVVFTNLSQDHMDYHPTEEHYRAAKSKLFIGTEASCALLNVDDDFGFYLSGRTSAQREITYGTDHGDIQLVECNSHHDGLNVSIRMGDQTIHVESRLLGRLNGINLTAVAAVLYALEIEIGDIEQALGSLAPVPGRLERISGPADCAAVFVDYAHTPDGLKNALTSIREITPEQLWCVFGCGGDRDQSKRAVMGSIAETLAEHVIVTDDNPRNESPQAIVEGILSGMHSRPEIQHNRERAIRSAIMNAGRHDSVLIAGKGHESTQTYGSRAVPFSDREAAAQILRGVN